MHSWILVIPQSFSQTHLWKVNTPGKHCKFLLHTIGQEQAVSSSGLEITNIEERFHKLPEVYMQTNLPVSNRHMPKQDSINKWIYLCNFFFHPVHIYLDN